MCGIAGVSFVNENKHAQEIGIETFKGLLSENTSRGRDATGICYLEEDFYQVVRGFLPGVSAKNLVTCDRAVTGILGHTRHATIGNKKNKNNIHPFVSDKFVGVHNGTIFNYKLIQDKFKIKQKGDTDSELVYSLMDTLGTKTFSELHGTYMLAYTSLGKTDTINVITNGSKPMIFIKAHGLFVAFGSIAEKTIETWESFFKKIGIRYSIEEIKPCTLYKLKNGKITRRNDMSNRIKYMSPEEGKLRYTLDFQGLNAETYKVAVPVTRRLGPGITPVKKVSASAPVTQGNMFSFTGDNQKLDLTASSQSVSWLDNVCSTFNEMFQKNYVSFQNDHTLFMDVEMLSSYVKFSEKKGAKEFVQTHSFDPKTNSVKFPMLNTYAMGKHQHVQIPTLLGATMLTTAIGQARNIKFVASEHIGMPEMKVFLANIFVGMFGNKTKPELEDYIQKELIDTGIIDPVVIKFSDYNKKITFLRGKELSLYYRSPMTSFYPAKDFVYKKLYSSACLDRLVKSLPMKKGLYDFHTVGNAWAVMTTLNRMIELMVVNDPQKRILNVATPPMKSSITGIAMDLNSEYYKGNYNYFKNYMLNAAVMYEKSSFCNAFYSPFRALDEASKEEMHSVFGFTKGGVVIPTFANAMYFANLSNPEKAAEVAASMIARAVWIREFSVKNNKKETSNIITGVDFAEVLNHE